jgi:hypothetical protein
MDKRMDTAALKLLESGYTEIPVNGFEWVDGFEAWHEDLKFHGAFLAPCPGPVRVVKVYDEVYLEVDKLQIEKEAVMRFANAHGQLSLKGSHFHRADNGASARGTSWNDWKFELQRFKATFTLWNQIEHREIGNIRRFVEKQKKALTHPGDPVRLQLPIRWPMDPLEFARAMVLRTINFGIAPELTAGETCKLSECGFVSHNDNYSYPSAVVLERNGSLDLVVTGSDLKKTAWLQLAELVCGQRKIKKCEAPDCQLYMDVTGSKRPGARRMHRTCEERLRKQTLRDRQRRARELSAKGENVRNIAKSLKAEIDTVKGWIKK